MTACHTGRDSVSGREDVLIQTQSSTAKDVILFLSGEASYDSISSTYCISIKQQKLFEGRMNLNGKATDGPSEEFNYQQVDASGKVLSQHVMDNPLITEIEYAEGDKLSRKRVVKPKADLFMRIQLNPQASKIVFRYGKDVIETTEIER